MIYILTRLNPQTISRFSPWLKKAAWPPSTNLEAGMWGHVTTLGFSSVVNYFWPMHENSVSHEAEVGSLSLIKDIMDSFYTLFTFLILLMFIWLLCNCMFFAARFNFEILNFHRNYWIKKVVKWNFFWWDCWWLFVRNDKIRKGIHRLIQCDGKSFWRKFVAEKRIPHFFLSFKIVHETFISHARLLSDKKK